LLYRNMTLNYTFPAEDGDTNTFERDWDVSQLLRHWVTFECV